MAVRGREAASTGKHLLTHSYRRSGGFDARQKMASVGPRSVSFGAIGSSIKPILRFGRC